MLCCRYCTLQFFSFRAENLLKELQKTQKRKAKENEDGEDVEQKVAKLEPPDHMEEDLG